MAWMAGGFALLATMLSAVGLYGIISHSVTRRSRAIGVRVAFGARRLDVLAIVIAEALRHQ